MTRLEAHPGVCGFTAQVTAAMDNSGMVRVTVETECELLQQGGCEELTLDPMALLRPGGGPGLICQGGHAACVIPVAVVKAVEVEAGLALPRDARITFAQDG